MRLETPADIMKLDPHDVLTCAECGAVSSAGLWTEGFVWCDLCGDHYAKSCPECGWSVDNINGEVCQRCGLADQDGLTVRHVCTDKADYDPET